MSDFEEITKEYTSARPGDVIYLGEISPRAFFAACSEPEKLPTLSGPVTMNDGTVIEPKEGVKFDTGKLRMDLIPPDAMQALARVLTDGAVKYGGRNWEKGMAWSRPHAALLRHLFAWWGGQDVDPESGHSHLWHVLTNAVFLAGYEMRGVGDDDRPVVWEVEG